MFLLFSVSKVLLTDSADNKEELVLSVLVFVGNTVKNGFKWMNSVGLKEDNSSLDVEHWYYRITNKYLYPITKNTSCEDLKIKMHMSLEGEIMT